MASVWTRSRFAAWMTLIAFLGMLANADKHQMEFKSVLSSFMIVLMSFLLNYAPLIIHLVRGGGVILFVSYILIISFLIDNFLRSKNDSKD